jgi:hypothetical protein
MRPGETPHTKSVLARLLNESKRTRETYNVLLARYVGFRFLYRLAKSPHYSDFLLRGATMFLFWLGEMHRPTKDFDLMGTSADVEKLKQVFREIAAIPCDADGLLFDLASIDAQPIREEQAYGGVRVTLNGYIGKARIPLQIDVGVGDAVTPGPSEIELPGILRDVPVATIRCYNMETAFAEKLEAMTKLELANSRMKDFYDLAKLVRDADLDLETLAVAIRATFKRRRTDLPSGLPLALTAAFWDNDDVRLRWSAFVRKSGIVPPANDLEAACRLIAETVAPLLDRE